jgi:hypothetical protein
MDIESMPEMNWNSLNQIDNFDLLFDSDILNTDYSLIGSNFVNDGNNNNNICFTNPVCDQDINLNVDLETFLNNFDDQNVNYN